MRPSTTVRIDVETHDRIKSLADQLGMQMMDTVRLAVETLERRRFFDQLASEVTTAGDAEVTGMEADELTVSDGLD